METKPIINDDVNLAQKSDMIKKSGAVCVGMSVKNTPKNTVKWSTFTRNNYATETKLVYFPSESLVQYPSEWLV